MAPGSSTWFRSSTRSSTVAFPAVADRRATDPEGLRAAWAALERAWAATVDGAAAMPADTVDVSVFMTGIPAYAEVLEVRANRLAMVRDYLVTATPRGPG